ASGLTGSSSGSLLFAARANSAVSASEPRPPPARARKSRRDDGTSTEHGRIRGRLSDIKLSIDEQELSRIHEGVAEIDVSGGFVGFKAAWAGLRLRGGWNICLVGVNLLGLGGWALAGSI